MRVVRDIDKGQNSFKCHSRWKSSAVKTFIADAKCWQLGIVVYIVYNWDKGKERAVPAKKIEHCPPICNPVRENDKERPNDPII